MPLLQNKKIKDKIVRYVIEERLELVTQSCDRSVCAVRFGGYSEARNQCSHLWCMYARLHHRWGVQYDFDTLSVSNQKTQKLNCRVSSSMIPEDLSFHSLQTQLSFLGIGSESRLYSAYTKFKWNKEHTELQSSSSLEHDQTIYCCLDIEKTDRYLSFSL